MKTEEHDDLWALLGKARETKASPYFSRNVLRAIREAKPEPAGFLGWVRAQWRVVAIATAAVAVMAVVAVERLDRSDPLLVLAGQVSASPDYQVISHLDELLDSEQNSVWLEASAY